MYIYSEKSRKKEKLIGRVPVQVKGTIRKHLAIDEISYRVQTADLKNYLHEGIVFFVVCISQDGDSCKIFYSALTPIKLKRLINKSLGNKTKFIKLKLFPGDNSKKFDIFINTFEHSKKQISFIDAEKISTPEELQEQDLLESITTSVSTCNTDNIDPMRLLISNEIDLYAKIKGTEIQQPLELPPMEKICINDNASISINGVHFYDSIKRIYTKESTILKIGESTTISIPEGQSCVKINYKQNDNLRILTKDLDFLLALLDLGKLELKNIVIEVNAESQIFPNFDISAQREMLKYLKNIVLLLDSLNAIKEIEISKLSQQDWKNLYILVKALIDKEPIKGLKLRSKIHFSKVKVASFKFALFLEQYNEIKGSYLISDFFKNQEKCYITENQGRKFETTKFIL